MIQENSAISNTAGARLNVYLPGRLLPMRGHVTIVTLVMGHTGNLLV